MRWNNIRAIVFDVDGTLYPQRPLRARVLLELAWYAARNPSSGFRALKILRAYREAHELARLGQHSGSARELQLRLASELCGERDDFVERTAREWFEQRPLKHLPKCLRPDLADFLREARERGIRLGVVSDYPTADKLEALGIADFFDAVISSQDSNIGFLKPHPRGLQTCLARLGVEPQEALYVGDRADVDLLCAARARTHFVLFARAAAHSDCQCISSYRQLGRMLGFQSRVQAEERSFVHQI